MEGKVGRSVKEGMRKEERKTSRWREQRGKSRAASGRREKSKSSQRERREEGEYSRLVFQLITTEGPGAAVRHIFFTIFFYYKH